MDMDSCLQDSDDGDSGTGSSLVADRAGALTRSKWHSSDQSVQREQSDQSGSAAEHVTSDSSSSRGECFHWRPGAFRVAAADADATVVDAVDASVRSSSSQSGVFYVSRVECAASAMEMSVIAARNVALLAHYDWLSCGGDAADADTQNSKEAQLVQEARAAARLRAREIYVDRKFPPV